MVRNPIVSDEFEGGEVESDDRFLPLEIPPHPFLYPIQRRSQQPGGDELVIMRPYQKQKYPGGKRHIPSLMNCGERLERVSIH